MTVASLAAHYGDDLPGSRALRRQKFGRIVNCVGALAFEAQHDEHAFIVVRVFARPLDLSRAGGSVIAAHRHTIFDEFANLAFERARL